MEHGSSRRKTALDVKLVSRSRIGWAFVASQLASGEARRRSIPRSGAVTDLPAGRQGSNEARSQLRRNPQGGMSFRFRLVVRSSQTPEGYASSLTPRLNRKSIAANPNPIRERDTRGNRL